MLTALLLPMMSDAHAGGFGIMATGGAHTELLRYYESVDENGNFIRDPKEYEQFEDGQLRPNFGGGIELLLGDRDDKIYGVSRFFYQQDSPQLDPSANARNPDSVVVAYREDVRRLGIGTIGLSWGIVGQPQKFLFGVGTHIGTAFMTNDYSDYFIASVGPMVTYRPTKQVMVFAEGLYTARYRWELQHQPTLNIGARYFFD